MARPTAAFKMGGNIAVTTTIRTSARVDHRRMASTGALTLRAIEADVADDAMPNTMRMAVPNGSAMKYRGE